jgi:lipopolysaccharide transport system ATP-binding protein
MSVPAIEVRHVSKRFRRGERHDSLRDLVPATLRRLRGKAPSTEELAAGEFWAVRDVSFAVRPGEALGIVGPNGAGKSTMLKLLTKILRPSSGRCALRGRFGALIEVAAGFHPDLTGRENIFLQGSIMGMRRAEIAQRLDQIIEFAGVGAFIDTPVKRYSSGMNARLGFAIAAHLDPDVLVIDEVLAVGDLAFQEKCIERMRQYKAQGVAIVFVSHNMQAVTDLCDRALFLESRVRAEGPTNDVLREFLRSMAGRKEKPPHHAVHLCGSRLVDAVGAPAEVVAPGAPLRLEVDFKVDEGADDVLYQFSLVRSTDNLIVYSGTVPGADVGHASLRAGDQFSLQFDFRAHLGRGHYHLDVVVQHAPTQKYLGRLSPAATLTIAGNRASEGVADLMMECHA